MCDTMCSLSNWSKDKNTLFAKNSDRPYGESHHVIWNPAVKYEDNTYVKCTYIEIPQVRYTHGTMLCKPSWCWGCEMGVNDRGVVIGNEAVYTNISSNRTSLIGMDYVRLALERSDSALEAVNVIINLLEKYGQGGCCSRNDELFYDNSFLIVDYSNGFLLETAGEKWAVRSFEQFEAISNELCIHMDYDKCCGASDFASELSDPVLSRAVGARQRRNAMLQTLISKPTVPSMMSALRLHNIPGKERKRGRYSICMHPERSGISTSGSLVAVIRKNTYHTLWVTGSSLPCLSMFKPIFLNKSLAMPLFADMTSAETFWKEREIINRNLLENLEYIKARDALELEWIKNETLLISSNAPVSVLNDFTKNTMRQEKELIMKYV